MKVTNYYIIRVFLHFKISRPCSSREKVKIINQNIIWRWRNYFKTFCVCERKFHKNLSRNDLCMVFFLLKIMVLYEIYSEKWKTTNSYVHLCDNMAARLNPELPWKKTMKIACAPKPGHFNKNSKVSTYKS